MLYNENTEKVPHSKKRKKSQRLLSLEELIKLVKPTKVSVKPKYIEVPVEKIIGSVNRSNDFGEDFLPIGRWMDERWLRVREVMRDQGFQEPIRLIEYGGYYFVQDGNHRVSIAKAEDLKYLYSQVIRYCIPIKLIPHMTRAKIPVFTAKYQFYKETKLFKIIPEDNFEVYIPETWQKLKFNIFVRHKQWLIETRGKTPGRKTLILDWNIEVYENALADIRINQLYRLFPGYGATDIFCELMNYVEEYEVIFSDPLKKMVEERQKKNFLQMLRYRWDKIKRLLLSSKDEQKNRFLWISRLYQLRPEASVPDGDKHWYDYLTRHLMGYYRYYFKKKHGKHPKMDELTSTWYDEWFLPAQQEYQKIDTSLPFPQFYMEWMNLWLRESKKGEKHSFRKSLDIYLKTKKLSEKQYSK